MYDLHPPVSVCGIQRFLVNVAHTADEIACAFTPNAF